VGFFRREFSAIGHFLNAYRNEIVVVGAALLFLTLDRYYPFRTDWLGQLVYYLALPLLVIVCLRKNPLDFGLRWGDVKKWGAYVGITCLVGAPILYIASRMPAFQAYYDIPNFSLWHYVGTISLSLLASEFFFRGVLIFGLRDRLKEASILVQMVPFVLVHFGKPELETLSTILTGLYFGFIVYRTKSFWPAFLIHLFINVFFVVSVNLLYDR